METGKHTPGLWKQDGNLIYVGDERIAQADGPEGEDGYYQIGNDGGRVVANARLIAAAPLMLDALQAAQSDFGHHATCDARYGLGPCRCAMAEVRAAIAAATGEVVATASEGGRA